VTVVCIARVLALGANFTLAQDRDSQPPAAKPAGEDIGARGTHPLEQIGASMLAVRSRLQRQDTTAATQQMQQSIVDGLSKLIDRQLQSGSQTSPTGSSGQRPQSANGDLPGTIDAPGSTPSIAAPPADNTDLILQQIWGQLPNQVRRHMETPLHEQFLPQYDDLIQDYFQRLSLEKPK